MVSLVAQYFLNHRLDHGEIRWQMAELSRAGYQAVHPHARQGLLTPYMSADWWDALDLILECCREHGMQLAIWDEDYFPSGLAGGRILWEEPGLAARGLEFTVVQCEGPGPFEVDFPPGMLLRAFAVPLDADGQPSGEPGPVDITAHCGTRRQRWTERTILHRAYSPGVDPVGHPHWRCDMVDNRPALSWTPPRPGVWAVVGAVVQVVPGAHPDILRSESVTRFLQLSHQQYHARYAADFGTVIISAFTDEPSPGGPLYPWTPDFPREFLADHGYDLLDWLPHLALDIDDRSATVRHHYRLTQHRLQAANYVGQIAHWCERHGILMTGHLTRTEWLSLVSAWWPNELRCYRAMHIPACDPLGASCAWPDAASYHIGCKVVSSAAHLFGREQASSDALAVVGDEACLRDLKFMLDYQMVLGINHFSVHGLSYSVDGPRKDEVPPSLFYQHSEWKHMPALLSEVRRTCEALTGGQHLCEIAVLYPSTSLACQATPRVNWHHLADEPLIHALVEQLLRHQRDFDFVDEVTLRESVAADGFLSTPEPYRVILLPHLRYLDHRTAAALERFALNGGRVLVIGDTPRLLRAGEPQAAPAPAAPAPGGWEQHSQLDDALVRSLPGPEISGEGARDVFVLRRRVGETIHEFLLNRREDWFRGTVDGVPVHLAPRGSLLRQLPGDAPSEVQELVADLSLGWTVTFEPNQLPLCFWHVTCPAGTGTTDTPLAGPGFDLMQRQPDPAGAGDSPVCYACRFMLAGQIADARLVIEDATVSGDWSLWVNDVLISDWQRAVVFDCRNLVADVGHALRGGSVPTLNVVTIRTRGPGRGLHEVPYLYGSFTCEYRYGHLSFPFLRSRPAEMLLDNLQPWGVLGCPTFSGSAVYARHLTLSEPGAYLLDLGRVEDVAVVSVNEEPPVTVAWPPYQARLPQLPSGTHRLTVEVTNAPANRNRAAGLPAGLLGPVRLYRG